MTDDYLIAFSTTEPAATYDRLSLIGDYRTRLALAANPSISEGACANLLRDRWEGIARTVACNPYCSWQARDHYLRELLAAVDTDAIHPDDALADSSSFRERLSVALKPSLSDAACATLLRDPVGLVAVATVLNPSCSPRALRDFLKDDTADQYLVRGYIPRTNGEALHGAVALEDEEHGAEPHHEEPTDGVPLEWMLLVYFPED